MLYHVSKTANLKILMPYIRRAKGSKRITEPSLMHLKILWTGICCKNAMEDQNADKI